MTRPRPDWERSGWRGPGSSGVIAPDQASRLAAQVVEIISSDAGLQERLHSAADTDVSPISKHHTLGGGPTQAAAGTHDHALDDLRALTRAWKVESSAANSTRVLADAETKDALGDLDFEVVNERAYLFSYSARFVATTATIAAEARIRCRDQVSPGAVATTDFLVRPWSVPIFNLGGSGAVSFEVTKLLWAGADLQLGTYKAAAFYDIAAGSGTLSIDQPSGGIRELRVIELGAAEGSIP